MDESVNERIRTFVLEASFRVLKELRKIFSSFSGY
jgi:hypothetical protein